MKDFTHVLLLWLLLPLATHAESSPGIGQDPLRRNAGLAPDLGADDEGVWGGEGVPARLCPTSSRGECNGTGECVSGRCECVLGFSGVGCEHFPERLGAILIFIIGVVFFSSVWIITFSRVWNRMFMLVLDFYSYMLRHERLGGNMGAR